MIWWTFLTIPIVFITFILTGADQKQASDSFTDGQKITQNKN